MNKVILVGRLGKDVELKTLQSGMSVANMTIATSKKIKDQEKTEWHRIVMFSKTAENCKKYLSKGSLVLVEGEIQTRSYEKDGTKHYSTEILANNVQFLNTKTTGQQNPSTQSQDHSFPQNTPDPIDPTQDMSQFSEIPF